MASPAVDPRGVPRGKCFVCSCAGYQGGSAGLKCIGCGHQPAKHQNLSLQGNAAQSYGSGSRQEFSSRSNTHQYGNVGSTLYNASGDNYSPSNYYQQPVTKPCSAPDCTNPSFYNPSVGEFDYCSPKCRDKDLLPVERQQLKDDLKMFEDKVKSSAYIATVEKPGHGLQAPVSTDALSYKQQASRSTVSGKQYTFSIIFQKSPSRDVGLIINEEKYRDGTLSGLLVLGFEYHTKAEHLTKQGEIHLLDVITMLNNKEASPSTYSNETKLAACSMRLNRTVALPKVDTIIEEAKSQNPTHLVAVRNPKDVPYCSTEKGFGLGVTICGSTNFVCSVTENTPARYSRLEYGDEIISFGFVNNGQLEIGSGNLDDNNLQAAASAGKTLVIAIKRVKK